MDTPAKTNQTLNQWVRLQALGIAVSTGLFLASGALVPFLVWNVLAFSLLAYWFRKTWRFALFPGSLPNAITWVRLLLFLGLIPVSATSEGWELSLVAWISLSLDGLDGLAARRLNQQSVYGEYFDKEADAVFVLTMSLILFDQDVAGGWILGFGLIRYAFLALEYYFKPLQQKDPRTQYGRIIAGIVMAAMASAPALPPIVNSFLLPAAGLLLAYSFGRSFAEMIAAGKQTGPFQSNQPD